MTTNLEANIAPALTLTDFRGQLINLNDYQGQKHIVLVFNRGFM